MQRHGQSGFETRDETFSIRSFDDDGCVDVRVRTCVAGDRGPTLIAVHGFGDNLETWVPLARELASHPSAGGAAAVGRIVAFDLPGFGASTLPAALRPHFSDAAIELSRAVAARVGVGPTYYVGNSMGGAIALGALVRDAREGVRGADGALLLSPATPATRTPIFVRLVRLRGYRILDEIGRRMGEPGRRRIARAVLAAFFKMVLAPGHTADPDWARSLERSLARAGAALDLETVARELRAVLRSERPEIASLHADASLVGVPVVVARGAHDRVIGDAELVELTGRLPNGRYLELPDVGHVPQIESPARVAELVVELVRRSTTSDAAASRPCRS